MKKILNPPAYLFTFLILGLFLHFVFPIKKLVYFPWNLLGIVLIVFGSVLNVWADSLFKKEKTTIKPFEKPSVLVVTGPFRLSRHPMYLGMVMLLLGVAVLLGSLSSFLAPLLMFISCEKFFIPHEEKSLEKIFGGEYKEYRKRVRR